MTSPQNTEQLKKSAFSGSLWKFAEQMGIEGVALVVSIVLARLLTPDEFAPVGVVNIFFSFGNMLIVGGLNTALIQKKEADEKDFSSIFTVSLAASVVLYAALFFLAPAIAAGYRLPVLTPMVRLYSVSFFLSAAKSVVLAKLSRQLAFRKIFVAGFGATVLSAAVGVGMAYLGFGAWALVGQQLTNLFVSTLAMCAVGGYWPRLGFCPKRFGVLFSYGGKMMVASLISTVYEETSPLIIGLRFTGADLSFYTKGRSFPKLLNSTVTSTLSTVLFPVMSKVQDSRDAVLAMTRRYLQVSSFLVFPLMAGFFGAAENFVRVLLTDKWLDATVYIQIFCLSYMFNIIQVGNLETIKAIGRSDISLILEVLKKGSYFVVILLFVLFTNSPVMLAVSSIVCTLIAMVLNTYPNRKLIGYRYRLQVQDLALNLFQSLVMGAAVLAVNLLPWSPVLLLGLQVLVGVGVYLLLSFIFRNPNLPYLWKVLSSFGKKRS